MDELSLANEQENKKKGMKISAIIHILLLLLAFFWILPNDPDKNIDTQYAVTIAFDRKVDLNTRNSNSENMKSTSGKKRPQNPKVDKIKSTPKKKITPVKPKPTPRPKPKVRPTPQPKPSRPVVSHNTEPESPIVAVDSEIEVDAPEPDVYEEPTPVEIVTAEPEPVQDEPSLDEILAEMEDTEESDDGAPADFESDLDEAGGGLKSDGTDEDTGSGTGDEGIGLGDGDSGNDTDDGIGTGGNGDGDYDDSGRGIFGRKIIVWNTKEVARTVAGKSGKFVFKVCIDPEGYVSYVEVDELRTTIKNRNVIKKAMAAMWKYQYKPDTSAPAEECGKFTFNIDNFQGFTSGGL